MTNCKNKPNFRLIWKISAPILFAFMPIFGAAQNPQKEKEEKKLEQAIQDLEKRKNRDICDSLYQVTNIDRKWFGGDVEKTIQLNIDVANSRIENLRCEAIRPVEEEKYRLLFNKFLTLHELNLLNQDFSERAIMSAYNCKSIDSTSILNIDKGKYFRTCLDVVELTLAPSDSPFYLEKRLQMLDYLENRSKHPNLEAFMTDTTYTQVPNENPVVMMRDGKLLFTNPESQKLYEQYKNEMANVDKTYIFTNPEFAARYLEYSAALKEAYEDREKLRQIGDFFTKKYQPQIDSLTYQLNQLKGNNR